jgi:tRNA pseudouridine38-40 synthase
LDGLHAATNGLLPKQIRVREISPAHPEFHARFHATSKVYQYKIYNEPVMDPLHRLYTFHSVYKLNPEAIREAATYFVGKHDFSSFGNAPSRNDGTPNPVKEIFRFNINESVSYCCAMDKSKCISKVMISFCRTVNLQQITKNSVYN